MMSFKRSEDQSLATGMTRTFWRGRHFAWALKDGERKDISVGRTGTNKVRKVQSHAQGKVKQCHMVAGTDKMCWGMKGKDEAEKVWFKGPNARVRSHDFTLQPGLNELRSSL